MILPTTDGPEGMRDLFTAFFIPNRRKKFTNNNRLNLATYFGYGIVDFSLP
jgi:hypothetical protein